MRALLNSINMYLMLLKKTKRLTGSMNRGMLLIIYTSLVRSTVDYGVTVQYLCSKKNMQMIENIQRRVTRIVPELKSLSYEERLMSLPTPITIALL